MHLEPRIEQCWTYNWRPRSSELRDALGGHDRSGLQEYLEAIALEVIDLKVVSLEALDLEAVDQEACAMEAETLFIG